MKTSVAAIDFGTSKIVTLIADHSGLQRCDIVGAGVVAYDGYLEDGWNNPGELNEKILASISDVEKQCHRKVREINVGVPGMFTKVYACDVRIALKGTDPSVTSKDIREIFVQAENKLKLDNPSGMNVIIHSSPAWFMVDNGKKTLEPVGLKGRELSALISFVVADKYFVDEVNARLTDLGFVVSGFYSTVAGESMLFLPEEDRDRTAVLIDIGYLSTDVMVVEGDALMLLKTIDMGGGNISADLAIGLDIPLDEAEDKIKRRYVYNIDTKGETYDLSGVDGRKPRSFTRSEVTAIIEPRVDEIAEAIQDVIENGGFRMGNWSNVYLTGGGLTLNAGGREYLAARLGRPVRDIPKRTNNLSSHSFSSALGLVDLIVTTMEQNHQQSSAPGGGVKNFFRSLLGV